MAPAIDPDGCPSFEAEVAFDSGEIGTTFCWGVRLDGPAGNDLWAIASEVDDENSTARQQSFVLQAQPQPQIYHLTNCARLGAMKQQVTGQAPGVRFSLWAPNARAVDLVLADPARGYVADDGTGVLKTIPMTKTGQGIWSAGPADDAALADFSGMIGTAYMFHITKDDGSLAFRTDMYSRMQIGRGDFNPGGQPYPARPRRWMVRRAAPWSAIPPSSRSAPIARCRPMSSGATNFHPSMRYRPRWETSRSTSSTSVP